MVLAEFVTLQLANTASYSTDPALSETTGKTNSLVVCTAPRTVTAVRTWDSAIAAITTALKLSGGTEGISVVSANPTKQEAASFTPTASDVLTELLNTAYLIGMNSVADTVPSGAAYTVLGLRYADQADALGVQASGSLKMTTDGAAAVGRFVIHAPSVKARSIVIVITVGGVKITITIRW